MNWYVVATKPARERIAEHHLRNQAFHVFLPVCKKTVRHARKVSTRDAPLFPGYLFIRLDPRNVRWRSVNGTIGVKSIISQNERPVPLPTGFVEALMSEVAEDGTFDYRPRLRVGDKVELLSGPFARQVGELSKLDDRGRVAVLLNILSMAVPVRTTAENLLPA